jgi:chloramphenicol O-acetyltransferase type A
MAHYLDIDTWARREVFEFFRGFDKPYFNICTRVDVTRLAEGLRGRGLSTSMAYHYFALRAANEIEPFRYRLRGGRVFVHDIIHGGTTVLMPNEAFTLSYFDYVEDFKKFVIDAGQAIAETRAGDGAFRPRNDDDGRIHFTVVPWFSFTSFSHARNWGTEDSIPKIAFGKFVQEHERILLPISVEVHHALLDGFSVGRYLTRLEEMLAHPESFW